MNLGNSARLLLTGRPCLSGPAWHPLGRGVQAPALNPLLALAPQPVGLCLYLVTLGGFASSTGIWHRRWKISLVRSPWKQAEPLRRFTLNGVHPACISCPVCLEFPPRPLEPLSRPGAWLQRRPRAFALRVDADSFWIGLLHSGLWWPCVFQTNLIGCPCLLSGPPFPYPFPSQP